MSSDIAAIMKLRVISGTGLYHTLKTRCMSCLFRAKEDVTQCTKTELTPTLTRNGVKRWKKNSRSRTQCGIFMLALVVLISTFEGCDSKENQQAQPAWPGEVNSEGDVVEISEAGKEQLELIYADAQPVTPGSGDSHAVLEFMYSLEPGMAATDIQMRSIGQEFILLKFTGHEPVTTDGMLVLRKSAANQWRVIRRYIFSIE